MIVREWGRIGCIGFGGPPAHIALLRDLCVTRRRWLGERRVRGRDRGDATCCPDRPRRSWRSTARGGCAASAGALVGGAAFIVPGLVLILALSALFLAASPPTWVLGGGCRRGRGRGRGRAARRPRASRPRAGDAPRSRRAGSSTRSLGAIAAATVGPWLVLVLLGVRRDRARRAGASAARPLASVHAWPLLAAGGAATGGLLALVWVAFKVGALSYGGGFVIIPLMQHDAVDAYHWMTDAQFLNAVALGQVTPGPGRAHRRGRRLRRGRAGRRPARRARRLRAVVLVRPHRRRPLRPAPREPQASARSSTAPGRPRSAPSWAPPSRSRSR